MTVAEQVLEFARAVLKEPDITLTDDFMVVGGDSLNGTQLVNRINEHFGTDLAVLDLFDHADLTDLAEAVKNASTAVAAPAPAERAATAEPAGDGPLSGQQMSMWAAEQLAPESNAYLVPELLLFDGVVDADLVRDRLAALVRRHPMLRTVLQDTEDGVRQVVHPDRAVDLERVDLDLTHRAFADTKAELTAALAKLVESPLSPYVRPVRAHLVRARFADTERDVLVLTVHHLFCDGWSWRVILDELSRGAGREPARNYLDFVRDQREALSGDRGRVLERFWADYLDAAPVADLPADHGERTVVPTAGDNLPLVFDTELVDGLRALARREHATLNMVLLAAWTVLLWKITGVRDQRVAVPVNGRRPEDENVVGCFVNTVAVRTRLRPHEPFRVCLADVRRSQLTVISHADLPTNRIMRLANPDGVALLAATNFGYHAGVAPITTFGDTYGVELLDVDPATPTFPLNVMALEYGTEIRARVKYAADRFRRDTVEAWLADFETLLRHLARDGEESSLLALFDSVTVPAGAAALPDFRF